MTSVMIYEKHGLLQLVRYEDGDEEILKFSGKHIGEMKQEIICLRQLQH